MFRAHQDKTVLASTPRFQGESEVDQPLQSKSQFQMNLCSIWIYGHLEPQITYVISHNQK